MAAIIHYLITRFIVYRAEYYHLQAATVLRANEDDRGLQRDVARLICRMFSATHTASLPLALGAPRGALE